MQWKLPHVRTKTWSSQTNKYFKNTKSRGAWLDEVKESIFVRGQVKSLHNFCQSTKFTPEDLTHAGDSEKAELSPGCREVSGLWRVTWLNHKAPIVFLPNFCIAVEGAFLLLGHLFIYAQWFCNRTDSMVLRLRGLWFHQSRPLHWKCWSYVVLN